MGTEKKKKDFIPGWTVRIAAVFLVLLVFRCGGTPGCKPGSDEKTVSQQSGRASTRAPAPPDDPIPSVSGKASADQKRSRPEGVQSPPQPGERKENTPPGVGTAVARSHSKEPERDRNATGESGDSGVVETLPSLSTKNDSTPEAEGPENTTVQRRMADKEVQFDTETTKTGQDKNSQTESAGTPFAGNARKAEIPAGPVAEADETLAPVQPPGPASAEGPAPPQNRSGPPAGTDQREQPESGIAPQADGLSEIVMESLVQDTDIGKTSGLRTPAAPQVDITNARFYRMSSGQYEARLVLRNITNYRVGRVNSSQICAQSTIGETVCAKRPRRLKIRQREAVWVMFGETEYPLEHVFIRN